MDSHGIAGDHLTYFVETNKASGRDTVLTRSLVRSVPTNVDNNNTEILNNAQLNTDSREEIAFNINNNDNNANVLTIILITILIITNRNRMNNRPVIIIISKTMIILITTN